MQFQDFTFGWHTMRVTGPAQSTLRQGDRDRALFSLLSDSDVSYMLIPCIISTHKIHLPDDQTNLL